MSSSLRMIAFLPAALVLSVSTSASAQITAFWQQNTITPQAIAADPALANMQSWSIMVRTDGNWASAGVEAILPAGKLFYNPLLGGNTFYNPLIVVTFPHIAFDTYVTGPGDVGVIGAPAILGFFPEAPGLGDFGGTTGRFSVSWGDLTNDPPGAYEIARLTWPIGVFPSINPLSHTSQVNPDSSSFIPDIPEPHSISLIVGAGMLVLSRRRLTRMLALVAIALLPFLATPASAQITAFWQQSTITPAAIAADPALANMQSWSLMATTTGNWASAGMEAILPAGLTFYNPPLSGNTRPNPALISVFPYLAFDTYVTAPGDTGSGAPGINGSFPNTGPGTADFGGTSGRFSVSWGDFVNYAPGTYEIARLTFHLAVVPEVRNLTPDPTITNPSFTMQTAADFSTIIPDIPETTATGVILGAVLLGMYRRRPMSQVVALLAIALLPLLSTPASAQITAFWQQNTITPAAIAADSTLANMQSWSLMATTTGNWASAGVEAILPAGNVFYNPITGGGNTKPNSLLFPTFPNVEFDTYVTSPADQGGGVGAPVLLGFWPDGAPGGPDFGGMSGRFSAAWGDLVVDPPGTFEIARPSLLLS